MVLLLLTLIRTITKTFRRALPTMLVAVLERQECRLLILPTMAVVDTTVEDLLHMISGASHQPLLVAIVVAATGDHLLPLQVTTPIAWALLCVGACTIPTRITDLPFDAVDLRLCLQEIPCHQEERINMIVSAKTFAHLPQPLLAVRTRMPRRPRTKREPPTRMKAVVMTRKLRTKRKGMLSLS